jgi:hypothetical protein
MISGNRIPRVQRRSAGLALTLAIMLTPCHGCTELMRAITKSPGNVDRGTWTGTVTTARVSDTRDANRAWDAAALELASGPQLPVPGEEAVLPGRALLIVTREQPLRILDPSDLGIEAGKRVRVSGTMIQGGVYAPPSAQRSAPDIIEATPVRVTDGRPTAVIVIRGKLEVLSD